MTFDPATLGYLIQYKLYDLYGNQSGKIDQPDYEGLLNFVVKADNLLLADAKDRNRNTAEAAEYLLDLLVWGDRKDL